MTKVQILTPCSYCEGQAYVPYGNGNNPRYLPCPGCKGSGEAEKLVSLQEFISLLQQAQCQHQQTSFQGGFRFSAGDVWDDIHETCHDCGANLDGRDYFHDPI